MRALVRPVPVLWWLRSRAYMLFVVREFTSVLIAAYLVVFLIFLQRIAAGPSAYESCLRWLAQPGVVAFHLIALAAALYHSITWLQLTPLTIVIRIRDRRVPAQTIVAANVAAWITVSIVIVWLAVGS
ncbi:MAG TPA: fumarate reductase subunit C [bacterium]|nr:fumarate reductase subunit C [bacterium]